MKSVSWNQITEDMRNMWHIYWDISDPTIKEKCKKAIVSMTQTVIRMHGMIPEEITNKN